MTEQFPPGYVDPEYAKNPSPADQIETIPDCEHDANDRCNMNPGAIIPFFSDRVLELADSLFPELVTLIEENPEFKELGIAERAALYVSIADAFSDTTDD